jgi:kumamolisin
MAVEHVILPGSERVALPGARATGRTNANATIEVSLKLRRTTPLPPLTGRPAATISRRTLAAKYGASPKEIAKVSAVFKRLGLTTIHSDAATRTVRLSGTVAAMEAAFVVRLFDYTHPDDPYRGRVGSIHVPVDVQNVVEGVFGLDNRRVVRKRRQPVRGSTRMQSAATVPASWYIPSELATHYNFPPGDGSGQTVGTLEFGGGYFVEDLRQFCSLAGVSVPKVTAISTDGTSTSAHDGAEGEVMLDIEVVAGVCPKAAIVAYFADFTEQGWITAIDAAVHDAANDPGVVSASWGYAEDADIWTTAAMTQVNDTLQEAGMIGVTVCLAAGDDGSSDAIADGHAHVDFPGSSPYVLSVGGTTIPVKNGKQPDIVWKEGDGLRADNGGSTGGGCSTLFPRPVWQKSVKVRSVNPGAIVGRVVPDVAANADWVASPYLLVVDGQAQANGGTSAATPLCASLIALMNAARGAGKRVGYLTPVLYQGKGGTTGTPVGTLGCTDVTSGENTTDAIGGYNAGKGYDAVSGWGTPNGKKLLAALPSV